MPSLISQSFPPPFLSSFRLIWSDLSVFCLCPLFLFSHFKSLLLINIATLPLTVSLSVSLFLSISQVPLQHFRQILFSLQNTSLPAYRKITLSKGLLSTSRHYLYPHLFLYLHFSSLHDNFLSNITLFTSLLCEMCLVHTPLHSEMSNNQFWNNFPGSLFETFTLVFHILLTTHW